MFNRSIRPVLSFYVSDVEIAEAALRDADVLWQSLGDRPIYDMTSEVYSQKTHEIFLFLQDHRHILDMEGRFPLSVDIYREMMNALDEEMRRSYSAGGALVGDIRRLLPQFIDALNREIGSSISQGVRSRSCVFSARHSKTELKRVHHNILGMLDEAVSYVNMHRDSFKPRELMSILSAAPQALAILAEGMRDIDFEVAGELRSIGRHIEDMIADLRSGASDVNLDYLMGDLFDYLDTIDSFRSYLTSSRVFNARRPKDKRKHYSFTDIIMMLDESISYLDMNRDSFSPGDFIYVFGVVPQAVSVLAEDVEDINSRIAGELQGLGRQLEEMVADLRSGESDVDYLLNSLFDCMNTLVDFRSYLTSSRARSYGFRQLSSGVKDSVSIMEFCDYWELERDHRGILMDELDTDDVDEVFPWGMMLEAMNRAKVSRADEWYGGFTEYYDPVDFSEFIS